jgi:serine/threonine-protein kinase HipA
MAKPAHILCGNTDDHARNHAGFWDGKHLTLTTCL